MKTKRDHRKTSREFREAMIVKRDEKLYRPHWREATIGYLLKRLEEEAQKLREAIVNVVGCPGVHSAEIEKREAMRECADVANFAMMLWDKLRSEKLDGSFDSDYLEPEQKELLIDTNTQIG